MRLATRADGTRDGELVLVSGDRKRCLPAAAPSLLAALEDWPGHVGALQALCAELAAGQGEPLDRARLRAPLPRSWQWLDGSAWSEATRWPSHSRNLLPTPRGLAISRPARSSVRARCQTPNMLNVALLQRF